MTIQAVTDSRGSFRQNENSTMLLHITDFDGNHIDAETISIDITDSNDDSATSGIPEKVVQGFYAFDWDVDPDQTVGKYTVTWSYTIDGTDYTKTQSIVISNNQSTVSTEFYSGVILDFRIALESHLGQAQRIAVTDEEGRPNKNRDAYSFAFKNWNPLGGVRVYRNQELIEEGCEVDYVNGKIVFDTPLLRQEVVNTYYHFKWFSDSDLDRFLSNGLHSINAMPPVSAFSLANLPERHIQVVLYGAAKDALRRLMMDLQYQVPQQAFGGPEGAAKAFSNFATLKENFEKDWNFLLTNKKYGPYPQLRIISTPEFTLPGGRSRYFRLMFK